MRRQEQVAVPAEWGGRDAGKHFFITEMPAMQAEKWAYRLIIALKGTSAEIPESIASLGMVAVAIRGINAILAADIEWGKLEPLLDEMMDCVKMIRNPLAVDQMTGMPVISPIVSPDDIEEVRTRGWLRSEVLRVHTGFSFADALSKWASEWSTIPTDLPNT